MLCRNVMWFAFGFVWMSAWSLTDREKHRLIVSESKVLRRIFEPESFKLAGGWRKLRKVELLNLHSWTSIFR
jgi:hypothetical protein